ncbi:MAG: GatB/YqeY domain-containing protein [Dehalococcoidales bacterium]|nr:GatB/YqeY domain-containing protein [Dehalococcoidales bacterium]
MSSILKQKLNEDLKHALKSSDKLSCSVIRMLLSAIHNAEIAKRGELEESEIIGVIAKDAKQHKESILAFKQGNRQDLVDKETAELAIIEKYLPEQVSREDVVAAARKVIEEVGAQGPRDKGKVMGKLVAQLKGKAEGQVINEVVNELLEQ